MHCNFLHEDSQSDDPGPEPHAAISRSLANETAAETSSATGTKSTKRIIQPNQRKWRQHSKNLLSCWQSELAGLTQGTNWQTETWLLAEKIRKRLCKNVIGGRPSDQPAFLPDDYTYDFGPLRYKTPLRPIETLSDSRQSHWQGPRGRRFGRVVLPASPK
jgi:hypothetical protein